MRDFNDHLIISRNRLADFQCCRWNNSIKCKPALRNENYSDVSAKLNKTEHCVFEPICLPESLTRWLEMMK